MKIGANTSGNLDDVIFGCKEMALEQKKASTAGG